MYLKYYKLHWSPFEILCTPKKAVSNPLSKNQNWDEKCDLPRMNGIW